MTSATAPGAAARIPDLERSCWASEHLLAHCEGFRVESREGIVGYVEEVVREALGAAPLALRVRTGGEAPGHVTVVIEDVLELRSEGERIVVRTRKAKAATRA